MKAWYLYGTNDMRLKEVPDPVLKEGYLLAEIRCAQPSVTETQMIAGQINPFGFLEKIEKDPPEIILLDIKLGDESGFDILKKVKTENKDICVLMLTGLRDDTDIQTAKQLGADDYISKPLVTNYLERVILEKISLISMRKRRN